MDLFSHVLWAYIIFRHQPWAGVGVAFCVFPDVIWSIPLVILRINLWLKKRPYVEVEDIMTRYLFRCAHSTVTAALAAALTYYFFGFDFAIGVLFGWLLHIILDVWTHKGGIVNGIRLFYPLNEWRLPALLWWREELRARPWIYLLNLGLAAMVYYLT